MVKRKTKAALISSVLSLFLCFTMLLGTTFAWFTDSATSAGNKIVSGSLTLDLELLDKDGGWNSIKENNAPIFNYEYWEPGYTDVKILKIENEGNLALKWRAKIVSQNELSALADVIDVYVCSSTDELAYPVDNSLDGYDRVGTLGDFVQSLEQAADGNLEAGKSSYIGIALRMQDNVGNEYQGLTLGGTFDIMIFATQLNGESDSFGSDYDKDALYSDQIGTSNSLYASTLGSGSFALFADINTSDADYHYSRNREYAIISGRDYTLDLNGHVINHDGTYQDGNNTGYTYLYTTAYNGKLTINGDGVINSANSEGYAVIAYAQGPSEIVINSGEFNVDKGIAVWAGKNATVTINGGSFISTGSNSEELIYSSGGIININGGFFHNTLQENRPVNVADANRSTGYIYISGGTFVNFDPSTGGNDPDNIKIVDGYIVVSELQDNGDVWYTVKPVPEGYTAASTATEVSEALAAGEKVVLTENVELTEAITVAEDAVIDLNGKTLTSAGITFSGDVTIENGTITSAGATNLVPHLSVNGGNLTMKNVTVNVEHTLNANVYWTEAIAVDLQNATATLNNCNIKVENPTSSQWVYSYGIGLNNADLTLNGGSITALCVDGTSSSGPTNPHAISSIGQSSITLNDVEVTATYYATTVDGHLTINTTDRGVTSADIVDNRGGSHTLNYID